MKLFTFGDSWTEGVGAYIANESTFENGEERKLYRNSLSWSKRLSEFLEITDINLSRAGSSNKEIFDKIIETTKSGQINENDLVVVMWSSSLRDDVPFFPNGEWHIWGKNYTNDKYKFNWIINSIQNNIKGVQYTKNPEYNFFLKNYKEFYLTNIFNEIYYNIVNQNYILFIQELLKSYNIKYVFCDAFDLMIQKELIKEIDNTQYIRKENYYGYRTKTLKDHLISIDETENTLWESSIKWSETPGKHPNAEGYFEIAKELYKFIIDSDILKGANKKTINII